jgi:hypothetical protein
MILLFYALESIDPGIRDIILKAVEERTDLFPRAWFTGQSGVLVYAARIER